MKTILLNESFLKIRWLISFLCLITLANNSYGYPLIRLNKTDWNFGKVAQGSILNTTILIKNLGSGKLNLTARASCDCLTPSLSKKTLLSKEVGKLSLQLNTSNYQKKVEFFVFINTNDPQNPYITISIEGYIESPIINISMFASSNCHTCRKIINQLIPNYEDKYNIKIHVAYYPLNKFENYEKLISLEQQLQDTKNKLPAVVIGNKILGGKEEVFNNLETYIKAYKQRKLPLIIEDKIDQNIALKKVKNLKLIPIFLAGFIDGINPCAFVTIIFLLSYLVFIGRNRRQIFLAGISFTLAVFLIYLLIGLGIFKFIQNLSSFVFISQLIYFFTVAIVFILSGISFYDCYLIKRNKSKDIILQLPHYLKKKIHENINIKYKNSKYIISSFSLGITISIFEFACTGQIYLPTIIYMTKIPSLEIKAFFYLLFYNLSFILPLVIIFSLVLLGVTSKILANFFQKHLFQIKFSMGLLFILLGILLLLYR